MNDKHPLIHWIQRLSPAQLLLIFYFIAIIVSTTILSFPIVYKDDKMVPFIDIIFTAVSALTVTGLSTISVAETFNTIGLVVLIIIMHLGAVGVMAVSTAIWLLLGKRIGLAERRLIMQDQNQTSFGGMVSLVKQIIYIILGVELMTVLILGTYYLRYFSDVKEAYFQGLFTTITAMSNAGFSLDPNSLAIYSHDYFVQLIVMFLIIFGAIGFPVIIEVKHYIMMRKKKKRQFRFSLFTKVTTSTFFLLIFTGTFFLYLIDRNGYFADKTGVEGLFYALFQSITTRSAGLTTMDINLLSETNHLFMSALMFIGASPSSAGGGIRTTTFALVVIFIITYARGGKSIKLFNREIYEEDLLKAVTVTMMAIILVFTSLLLITYIEPHSFIALLVETTSAFGTVGLSLGITSELTTFSKVLLMVLMFIGRVGVVTFLFSFRKSIPDDTNISYPKERMIIG